MAAVTLSELTDHELTKATTRRNHPEVTRLLDLELSYRFKLRGFDPSTLTPGQRMEGLRYRADVAARKGAEDEARRYREEFEKVLWALHRKGQHVLETEDWGDTCETSTEVAHG